MVVYAVSKNGRRTVHPTFRQMWSYRYFFNAENEGVPNRYGERPYHPALLIKNLRLLPPLFYAGSTMFVSEAIADELRVFDGVDLCRAAWHRVYDWPVDEASILELEGPSPPFDRPEFQDITEDTPFKPWLRSLMRPPPPELRGRAVYEVLTPHVSALQDRFGRQTPLNIPHPSFAMEQLDIPSSPDLYRIYPMIELDWSAYACIPEVYRVIEPHVQDRDLFIVTRLEV